VVGGSSLVIVDGCSGNSGVFVVDIGVLLGAIQVVNSIVG
jgi:hypothetical protein